MKDKVIKITNIALDILVVISLIILSINELTKFNVLALFITFTLKIALNFKKIDKKYLYISILADIILVITSYIIIKNAAFQFNGYIVISTIAVILILFVIIRFFKNTLSIISYLSVMTILCITFGNSLVYKRGLDDIQSKYTKAYLDSILEQEETGKYSLKRVNSLQDSLIEDRKMKENIFKVIKAIEKDTGYISVITRDNETKIEVLSDICINFLNNVNKRTDCTISDLYNSDYITESIAIYGGK